MGYLLDFLNVLDELYPTARSRSPQTNQTMKLNIQVSSDSPSSYNLTGDLDGTPFEFLDLDSTQHALVKIKTILENPNQFGQVPLVSGPGPESENAQGENVIQSPDAKGEFEDKKE